MTTIFWGNSLQTRVEFKKDATGKILGFMLQGFGQEETTLSSKSFKSEKAAIKWATKVLA